MAYLETKAKDTIKNMNAAFDLLSNIIGCDISLDKNDEALFHMNTLYKSTADLSKSWFAMLSAYFKIKKAKDPSLYYLIIKNTFQNLHPNVAERKQMLLEHSENEHDNFSFMRWCKFSKATLSVQR